MDAAAAFEDARASLAARADADRSAEMSRYMRERFAFFGVTTADRRAVTRPIIRTARGASNRELLDFARHCWVAPQRELQYVAVDALREGRAALEPTDLDALRGLIATTSWWDTVDALASWPVGSLVRRHPGLAATMDDWIRSDDIWVARAAMLHQLRYGEHTDPDRLFRHALCRGDDTEFFIRKAIGWALREYSKVAPGTVAAFVTANESTFSCLTVREARRHLRRVGL